MRADLAALADRLAGFAVRLQLRAVTATPESDAAALAQAFEDRLLLDEITQDVRRTHQKLLSLYPAVTEETVEAARQLADAVAEAAHGEAFEDELGPLARRLARWIDDVEDALA